MTDFKSYGEGTNLAQTDGKAIKTFQSSVLNLNKNYTIHSSYMLAVNFL